MLHSGVGAKRARPRTLARAQPKLGQLRSKSHQSYAETKRLGRQSLPPGRRGFPPSISDPPPLVQARAPTPEPSAPRDAHPPDVPRWTMFFQLRAGTLCPTSLSIGCPRPQSRVCWRSAVTPFRGVATSRFAASAQCETSFGPALFNFSVGRREWPEESAKFASGALSLFALSAAEVEIGGGALPLGGTLARRPRRHSEQSLPLGGLGCFRPNRSPWAPRLRPASVA